jgi:hypothetical protein
MPGHHRKAGRPPKKINEKYVTRRICCMESSLLTLSLRKQSARSPRSNSAPKTSSSRSGTSTPKTRSLPKKNQTNSKTNKDWNALSHTEENFSLGHLSGVENPTVDPCPNESLPLWAHRYGDEHHLPPRYEVNIEGDRFDQGYPHADEHSIEVICADAGDDGRLSEPNSQGASAANYQSQFNNCSGLSTYPRIREETQLHPGTGLPPGHLQKPVFNHRLDIWVYTTLNSEITFTERMEKSNWEPHCLMRL